jgi:hypothetical protein
VPACARSGWSSCSCGSSGRAAHRATRPAVALDAAEADVEVLGPRELRERMGDAAVGLAALCLDHT